MRNWILILIVVLLIGCKKEITNESLLVDDIEMPDIHLINSSYTLSTGDTQPIYIQAKSIKIYLNDELVILDDFSFTQYDEDGSLYIEGSSGRGKINTKSKLCSLDESAYLKQVKDNLSISSSSLTFNSNENLVDSKDDVIITFDDSIIKGRYLSANLNSLTFELLEIYEGGIEI